MTDDSSLIYDSSQLYGNEILVICHCSYLVKDS